MWEDNVEPDEQEDFLSESRMYVLFASGGNPRRAFGPFRTVQVTGDSVWVYEGQFPLRIASKEPGGSWEIPDGSDQPATFRHVLVLCPPIGVTAAQIEERLSPRARE
jgi:hypothetical protein